MLQRLLVLNLWWQVFMYRKQSLFALQKFPLLPKDISFKIITIDLAWSTFTSEFHVCVCNTDLP